MLALQRMRRELVLLAMPNEGDLEEALTAAPSILDTVLLAHVLTE